MATHIERLRGLRTLADVRVRQAAAETCRTIRQAFPEAECEVVPNPGYRGAIIDVHTDSEDAFPVLDLVHKRLVDLLIEEDIDIQVVHQNRAWHPGMAIPS